LFVFRREGFLTVIQRSAFVPYSQAQMFQLVNDVEQYPQFLPWCAHVAILNRSADEIEATVTATKGPWRKSFTTVNRLLPHDRVEMRLRNGPFRHLEGHWEFKSVANNASHVSLHLSFEFNNKLIAMAFGPLFQQMAGTLLHAFTQRAHQIYASQLID